MIRLVRFVVSLSVLGVLAAVAAPAAADTYPSKPIKLVVPFPAGGATDIIARVVAQKAHEAWRQPVIVDNRPGAGGNIGADIVAKSPADGYTLLMGTVGTHAINSSLYSKMTYDHLKDFQAVTLVATVPNVLVVHPSVPAKSVKDLVALAKSKPGQLNFASTGNGTSIHLCGELFKTMVGVDIVHIPYKGSAPALTDLLGGQVNLMFDNLPPSMPHIKAGKLRALAVTTAKRASSLPDVPTMAEAGVPGFEAFAWFGLFAPTGTPKEVIAKWVAEVQKALKQPEVQEKLAGQGADPVGNTPEEYTAFVKAETAKWAAVVKKSGAKLD